MKGYFLSSSLWGGGGGEVLRIFVAVYDHNMDGPLSQSIFHVKILFTTISKHDFQSQMVKNTIKNNDRAALVISLLVTGLETRGLTISSIISLHVFSNFTVVLL